MGARLSTSVENLFMACWEAEEILCEHPEALICYKSFIDDQLIICKGDQQSSDEFRVKMDSNSKNIKLSWTLSTEQIVFLGLEIFKEQDRLLSWNHFKPTDRNSYLPWYNYCHISCLCNIPKGQFIRICRNCSKTSDFL